jgi:hypothetical protein
VVINSICTLCDETFSFNPNISFHPNKVHAMNITL